jgi:retron-type reverse transcriptase
VRDRPPRLPGGRAPGPDGLDLAVLDEPEKWEWARTLGAALRSGTYRAGPHREVKIPKSSGRGTRTLQIQDAADRVVQRAIVQVAQPYLDPAFSPLSFGFRPGLGREHALTTAGALMDGTGNRVGVFEDVRDAFDQVPLRRLLDVVRRRIPADDFVALVAAVIARDGKRGLRQGGALSPLMLNVYTPRGGDLRIVRESIRS